MGVNWISIFIFACFMVIELKAEEKTPTFYNTEKCGKSAGCWYFPNGCNDQTCHGIVRWKVHKNLVRIELQAKDLEGNPNSGRYMALGIGNDQYMGNDTVFECVFDGNGKAKAFVSYNDHTSNIRLEDASTKLIKLRNSVSSDGRLLCKIDINFGKHKKLKKDEKENVISTVRGNKWTLLFAQGLADPETHEKFIHAFYPWSTDDKVEICDDCKNKFQVLTQTSPHEIQRM